MTYYIAPGVTLLIGPGNAPAGGAGGNEAEFEPTSRPRATLVTAERIPGCDETRLGA